MQNNVIMQVEQSFSKAHINTVTNKKKQTEENSLRLVILQVHSSLIKMTYMRDSH